MLLGRRTRAVSPVVVLLPNSNKHNVMDPLGQHIFNFIVLPSVRCTHCVRGFRPAARGHSCKLCTLLKCQNKLDRYSTYCYFSTNRPADLPTIMGVALFAIKGLETMQCVFARFKFSRSRNMLNCPPAVSRFSGGPETDLWLIIGTVLVHWLVSVHATL